MVRGSGGVGLSALFGIQRFQASGWRGYISGFKPIMIGIRLLRSLNQQVEGAFLELRVEGLGSVFEYYDVENSESLKQVGCPNSNSIVSSSSTAARDLRCWRSPKPQTLNPKP